jgi:hypothetical protein
MRRGIRAVRQLFNVREAPRRHRHVPRADGLIREGLVDLVQSAAFAPIYIRAASN